MVMSSRSAVWPSRFCWCPSPPPRSPRRGQLAGHDHRPAGRGASRSDGRSHERGHEGHPPGRHGGQGGYFFAPCFPAPIPSPPSSPASRATPRRASASAQRHPRLRRVDGDRGQSEKIEVTAEREIIQTQTGAREGVITAAQIENLSIISRSPWSCCASCRSRVPRPERPPKRQQRRGRQQHRRLQRQRRPRQQQRDPTRRLALDRHRVQQRPDHRAQHRLRVGGQDPVEQLRGRVRVGRRAGEHDHQGRQLRVPRDRLRLHAALQARANDRSNSIAGVDRPQSKYQYPGGNLSGPILIPGTDFNKNRDKAFFFLGVELWRQNVDTGSIFRVVPRSGSGRATSPIPWAART